MSKVKHCRGWVLVEDVEISEELSKRLSESSTHIYRDAKGEIINNIVCVKS